MVFLSHLLVGTAIVAGSAASPASRRHGHGGGGFEAVKAGFTASQGISKKSSVGAVSRANTYAKFGKTVPAKVASAVTMYLDGTGVATPEIEDEEYLVPVVIGGETLNLDFDTGSSDLWVYSSELTSSDLSGHSYYTPSATATELTGYTWSISYGDGSTASGNVYTDWVAVGDTNVTGQAVELAEKLSSSFLSDTDNDGLLGLAFSSLNTVSPKAQDTFIANAISEGVLDSPLFTADLKAGAPGTYDFGFIDETKYNGTITYTAITDDPGYWEFTGTGYSVGDGNWISESITAIADTGTTLLYLSDAICESYYAEVDGSEDSDTYGGWVFPCTADTPDLALGVGDYQSVIPGSYLNYAPVETGSSTCFGGLQSDDGIGFAIWGDIWLKSQFVIFDVGNMQLGVAPKSL